MSHVPHGFYLTRDQFKMLATSYFGMIACVCVDTIFLYNARRTTGFNETA